MNFKRDGQTYTPFPSENAKAMATKLTVALVGGIVIIVSIAILIIETLSSPSRCRPRGEIAHTEKNWVQKSEPVSSPSTILLSPRTKFPPQSTDLPSLGDAFADNSTPQPGTVLNTENVLEGKVTLPSAAEEGNDRQPREDKTITVTLPENSSSTINSATTSDGPRKIIITPPRKCGSGEKKDVFGSCRPIW